VGQDNLSLFPAEKRRVGGAALYGSRFGTGYIASGRPPRAKGDGGDRCADARTAVREEHEPKEAADCPEPPSEPPERPVCGEVQTATTGVTVAQAISGQGEAEACETPLPWEEEYDDATTTEEDDRLDWEVGQLLWDSDWEDDEDYRDLQRSYNGWRHGYGANSGWRAAAPVAACGATRATAAMSATRVHEEAAQLAETAGPRDEQEGAAWEAAYRDMWANMRARAVQGMLAHEEVSQVLAMSATQVHEEAEQPAETMRTATDEEGRETQKAICLAMIADKEDSHHARLAAMKQRLPSLTARLRRLWRDVGCARRPAPTRVYLKAIATVE
jgi:hypothetical protein